MTTLSPASSLRAGVGRGRAAAESSVVVVVGVVAGAGREGEDGDEPADRGRSPQLFWVVGCAGTCVVLLAVDA